MICMDSLFEEPRKTPKPTPIVQALERPVVPEISLLFQNSKTDTTVNQPKLKHSYNAWKLQCLARENEDHRSKYDSFLLTASAASQVRNRETASTRKQVRFEATSATITSTVKKYSKPDTLDQNDTKNCTAAFEKLYVCNAAPAAIRHEFQTNYHPAGNEQQLVDRKQRRPSPEPTNVDAAKNDKTPSVTDLLAIIQMQNEQLQVLQKQVEKLLKVQESKNDVEVSCGVGGASKKDVAVETSFETKCVPTRSVGVLTSFNRNSESAASDYTFEWQEPLAVVESPPQSPDHSIHVDMHDYDDDDDNDSDNGQGVEDFPATDAGWTFYNDVLGQVDHILRHSPGPRPPSAKCRVRRSERSAAAVSLDAIKRATYKHLNKTGFLRDADCALKPNEISFAVKQILIKYLPSTEENRTVRDSQQSHVYFNHTHTVTNRQLQRIPVKPAEMKLKGKENRRQPNILDVPLLRQQRKLYYNTSK